MTEPFRIFCGWDNRQAVVFKFSAELVPEVDVVRIAASAVVNGFQVLYGPIVLRSADYERVGKQRLVAELSADLDRFPPENDDPELEQPHVYVAMVDGIKVALPRFQRCVA